MINEHIVTLPAEFIDKWEKESNHLKNDFWKPVHDQLLIKYHPSLPYTRLADMLCDPLLGEDALVRSEKSVRRRIQHLKREGRI